LRNEGFEQLEQPGGHQPVIALMQPQHWLYRLPRQPIQHVGLVKQLAHLTTASAQLRLQPCGETPCVTAGAGPVVEKRCTGGVIVGIIMCQSPCSTVAFHG
jgi:hypothetical protein